MATYYNGKTADEWRNEVSEWEFYLKHSGKLSVDYINQELEKARENLAEAERLEAEAKGGGGTSSNPNFITGTSGADSIINTITGATINALGGADDDRIYNGYKKNSNSSSSITLISAYSSNSTVDGGDGNDYIENYSSNSSIVGGVGNDSIINGYDRLSTGTVVSGGLGDTVEGGAGNDSIRNYAERSLIDGGDGNDTITNATTGLTRDGAVKSTVKGGNGDDSIWNSRASVSIDGGVGNDTIRNYGSYVTITGGAGNDLISLGSDTSKNLIEYFSGNGNDSIVGFNSNTTLRIDGGSGTYSTLKSYSDIIVTVGENRITLKGVASLSSIHIQGSLSSIGGSADPKIVMGTSGSDSIRNTVAGATINALEGNDSINNNGSSYNNHADNVSINGGDGNDYIYNNDGDSLTISGGLGNDTIDNQGYYHTGKNSKLIGNDGDDSIYNHLRCDSVTVDGGNGDDTIENHGSNVSIEGSYGNDYIHSGGNDNTINGGAGDDSIILRGTYNDVISYRAGDGNDIIYNFNTVATLKIGDGTDTYSTQVSGSDIVVTVGDGRITLSGAASLSAIHIQGSSSGDDTNLGGGSTDPKIITGTEDADSIENNEPNVFVSLGAGNDSITNEYLGDDATIDGGEGNDFIYNYGGDRNSLNGGEGDDYIFTWGWYTTIVGGEGDDTFFNSYYIGKMVCSYTITGMAMTLSKNSKRKIPCKSVTVPALSPPF